MIPGGDASSILEVVLAGDLGLGVWPSPPQCTVTSEKKEMKKEQVKTEEPSVMPTLWPGSLFSPEIGDLPVHGVGKHNSQGHALLSLVGGVAEHKTLRMVGCR